MTGSESLERNDLSCLSCVPYRDVYTFVYKRIGRNKASEERRYKKGEGQLDRHACNIEQVEIFLRRRRTCASENDRKYDSFDPKNVPCCESFQTSVFSGSSPERRTDSDEVMCFRELCQRRIPSGSPIRDSSNVSSAGQRRGKSRRIVVRADAAEIEHVPDFPPPAPSEQSAWLIIIVTQPRLNYKDTGAVIVSRLCHITQWHYETFLSHFSLSLATGNYRVPLASHVERFSRVFPWIAYRALRNRSQLSICPLFQGESRKYKRQEIRS